MGRSQDRISALPDELCSHILSFLTTGDAVKTGVLSKRWKTVWHSINNLELTAQNSGPCLELHHTICELLEKLTLETDYGFDNYLPPKRCFPALKVLTVNAEDDPDEDLMKNLFCRCPVLEELTINFEKMSFYPRVIFNVSSDTLKRLTIEVLHDNFGLGCPHKFVIKAPKLEYIYITDWALLRYEVYDMPNIRQANINVGDRNIREYASKSNEAVGYSFQILRAISNTQYLTLSDSTMALLSYSFDHNILPQFPNLVRLELSIHACFGWKLLKHLLDNSPVLQVLRIHREYDMDYNPAGEDEVVERWIPPKQVPSCLSCVKEIQLEYTHGDEEEMEVVEYLLENSTVLENMVVRPHSSYPYSVKKYEQILNFPRGSESCQVEFR